MANQIMSELGNYVVSNVFAIFLILAAVKWPRLARLMVSVLFVGGGVWNVFASLTMPAFYVTTYGPIATEPYRAFSYGPFAANPALFVIPIALGELAIGILADGAGTWVKLSMVGMTGFMIGLAPLGVGGAFPFSLFAIVAAYVVFRNPPQTSLFQDIAAVVAALTRGVQRHPHPRPHG